MVRLSRNPGTSDELSWNRGVQLVAELRAAGLKDPDVRVLLRRHEIIRSMVDTMRSLIDAETSDWGPAERISLSPVEATPIAPGGLYVQLKFVSITWFSVNKMVEIKPGEWSWTNPGVFRRLPTWQEVVPGVQVRWPSDFPANTIEVRRLVNESVVEEAGTVDDEAGWNPAVSHNLSVGKCLKIEPSVRVKRESADGLWRVQTGKTRKSVVDRSTEWWNVGLWVQVRWPNGPCDSLIEVRTRTPKEPVVEEVRTADDEAGWRRPQRSNLPPGGGLDLAAGLSVERELAGSSWRFQNWEHVWSVVDGSAEWRDVTPEVQIRWPNGPSDSLIAVRKRVLRGRF